MKKISLESRITIGISIIIFLFENFKDKINELTMGIIEYLSNHYFTLGIVALVWGIFAQRIHLLKLENRKTQVLLLGIHILDNIRFHKIKDNKVQELLYLNNPDKANTMQEERELKIELSKPEHKLNESEINYICNALYWNKEKFKQSN